MAATALFDSIYSMLDVDYTLTPVDGDVLVFSEASGKWMPAVVAAMGQGRARNSNLILRQVPGQEAPTDPEQVFPAIMTDADAALGSIYFGLDHLDAASDPMLCRKSPSGNITVIG